MFMLAVVFSSLSSEAAAESSTVPRINRNTETSFEQVPLGLKLEFIFSNYAFYKGSHWVLSERDVVLMFDAVSANPQFWRTYQTMDRVCEMYKGSVERGDDLDLRWVGSQLALAEQYEEKDRYAPYLTAFEKLSPDSRQFVLNDIEKFRGTRAISSSTVDWQQLFDDDPDTALTMLPRMCDRLPELTREMEQQPKYKSFENMGPIMQK